MNNTSERSEPVAAVPTTTTRITPDRVALFRNGRYLQDVRLTTQEHLEELLQFARRGDTLHNIPEQLTHSSQDVMDCVRSQLVGKQFVPI